MSRRRATAKAHGGFVITDIHSVPAPQSEGVGGLIAWVSLTLSGCLRLDSLILRKTAHGEIRLTFPARRDSWNRQHACIILLDAETHATIEREVFGATGIKGVATP